MEIRLLQVSTGSAENWPEQASAGNWSRRASVGNWSRRASVGNWSGAGFCGELVFSAGFGAEPFNAWLTVVLFNTGWDGELFVAGLSRDTFTAGFVTDWCCVLGATMATAFNSGFDSCFGTAVPVLISSPEAGFGSSSGSCSGSGCITRDIRSGRFRRGR